MSTDRSIPLVDLGRQHGAALQQLLDKAPQKWHYVTEYDGPPEKAIYIIPDSIPNRDGIVPQLRSRGAHLVILLAAGEEPALPDDEQTVYVESPLRAWRLYEAVYQMTSRRQMALEMQQLKDELAHRSQELSELNKIGIALSAERDSNALLELILNKAREITSADAGSLYLIEKKAEQSSADQDPWFDKQLRFKLAQNDSLAIDYQEFVLPIQRKSMAGYTVVSGNPLNIADAYHLPPDSEFQHNRSFDDRTGYHTQSVLCIPMKSHAGELIGVLQLINRKKDAAVKLDSPQGIAEQIIPFDVRCVDLASSLASQAAVSIENMRLYEEIKRLFEGFILASVHAIEQRDPTTSGHSERVAVLTVAMAEHLDRLDQGRFRQVRFTRDDLQQIKYASLLHDFGKIGVREHVLVKAKKLYPEQLELVKLRFRYLKKLLEARYSKDQLAVLLSGAGLGKEGLDHLEERLVAELEELDRFLNFILEANEPRILPEQGQEQLHVLGQKTVQDNGTDMPLLQQDEIKLLSIARGSLSNKERQEIESHVTHTFNFLSRIPWAAHLRQVPEIAYAHHEKLDGTGYPRQLNAEQIPLPAKIMTISDIYDALTAWDRPYKKAVPPEKALAILQEEVQAGKIDMDLFKLFVEADIYKMVNRTDE
jgi:HD-GYP domain-containing protein (c-di-GMP phosphodiesterase class II)